MTLPNKPWLALRLTQATIYYISRVPVSARPTMVGAWPGLSHASLLTVQRSAGESAEGWMIRAGFGWADSAAALAFSWSSRRLALACANDRDSG